MEFVAHETLVWYFWCTGGWADENWFVWLMHIPAVSSLKGVLHLPCNAYHCHTHTHTHTLEIEIEDSVRIFNIHVLLHFVIHGFKAYLVKAWRLVSCLQGCIKINHGVTWIFYVHFGITIGVASKCINPSGNFVTPFFQTHVKQNKQYNS